MENLWENDGFKVGWRSYKKEPRAPFPGSLAAREEPKPTKKRREKNIYIFL